MLETTRSRPSSQFSLTLWCPSRPTRLLVTFFATFRPRATCSDADSRTERRLQRGTQLQPTSLVPLLVRRVPGLVRRRIESEDESGSALSVSALDHHEQV